MGTKPATVATIPKMLHLGAEDDREFHVAPGERVVFAGHGEFAVVFPNDSPFNEMVFSNTHARTLPARECQGRFEYFWARAGLVGTSARPSGVEVTGVFGPILKPAADAARIHARVGYFSVAES